MTAADPITKDSVLTDDILEAIGISPTPSDPATSLWEQIQEWAVYTWDTALDIPVGIQNFVQLMIPTINATSGMIDWIKVEINVSVTGTIYEWDGSDWMVKEPFTTGTDASDDISPITVYSKMKTLALQPNVFEPAGAKEFITEMKNLFYSIATDLQGNPVDAVDAVHTAVQSKADRIVILGHEEQ